MSEIKAASLEDVPLSKFHKRLAIYSAGGPFLDGYVLSGIGIVMAQITLDLQLSLMWQGLIASSSLFGMIFGGFLGGLFTDKLGRKTLYLLDLLAMIGFSVAQFWVESAWMLFVWRFLIGVAVGADHPLALSLLAEFLPKKYRGSIMSSLVMMWFVGAASAYLIGQIIVEIVGEGSWRWVLASALLPGAIFLAMRSGTPESARWLLSKGRVDEANAVIKKVYGDQYSVADLPEVKATRKVSVSELFHSGYGKRIFFIAVFWNCATIPQFAVYAFAPILLEELHLTGSMAAYGSLLITVIFVLGCLLAVKLIDVLGRRRMLMHSFLWSGLSLALLGIFSDASAFTIMILFGFYALMIGGAQVLEYVYPTELFPTEVRATAVGLATTVSKIGPVIGTYLVPLSLSSLGIAYTMMIGAAISFIGLWNAWAMAPKSDAMDLHEASSLDH